jgi:hypothetical protein
MKMLVFSFYSHLGWCLQREADLHSLAKALLEQETLDANEIKGILGPLHLEELESSRDLSTVSTSVN